MNESEHECIPTDNNMGNALENTPALIYAAHFKVFMHGFGSQESPSFASI
jgi:hypothetical protein